MRARRVGVRAVTAPALLLAALTVRCGGKAAKAVAPEPAAPPVVEAVYPPARATRVQPETEIWVRFREPLDPATVDGTHVFLKLDYTRLPADVVWDAPARTIRITPQVALRLRHTYTVELAPTLATAAGATLDSTYWWQFSITSLARFEHPWPLDGATGQGRYTALTWDRTEAAAGRVRYDVRIGPDSAAVRTHALAPFTVYTPWRAARPPYDADTPLWWQVDATNLDTGETLAGPLWSFRTLPDGQPVDSLVLRARSFGFPSSRQPNSPFCANTSMTVSQTNNANIRWRFEDAPGTLRLARVRMLLYALSGTGGLNNVLCYGTTTDFDGCASTYSGGPFKDFGYGALAASVPVSGGPMFLESDLLTAHTQAAITTRDLFGHALLAINSVTLYSPVNNDPGIRPALVLYYYPDPPGGTVLPARRASPARGH